MNKSDDIYVLHGCNGDILGAFKTIEQAKEHLQKIYNGEEVLFGGGHFPSDMKTYWEITKCSQKTADGSWIATEHTVLYDD
jgi:hypothetical protein